MMINSEKYADGRRPKNSLQSIITFRRFLAQFLNRAFKIKDMKKILLAFIVIFGVTACSTVSSILQNNFPFVSTFVVTSGSAANTSLSAVGSGSSLNQILGSSSNLKDIKAEAASVSVSDGSYGMGIFKSVKVYVRSGSTETLVGSRENIGDNIGNSLVLDVTNRNLDNIMKSGNSVQQKIVYELKNSPASDITIKSSLNFTSVPVQDTSK